MKSAWLGLCVCFIFLQGCSQQKAEQTDRSKASSDGQAAVSPDLTNQLKSAEPTAEQMKLWPKSQQLYFQARKALDQKKSKECMDLLSQAAAAAKEEKNYNAAIVCAETQAKIKVTQNDFAGASGVLEASIKDFDKPSFDPAVQMRLEPSKALLASVYALSSAPGKAEAILKQNLALARKQKPVIHQRVAFWLRNYADFYKFIKKDKESQAMQKDAVAELSQAAPPPSSAVISPKAAPTPAQSKK